MKRLITILAIVLITFQIAISQYQVIDAKDVIIRCYLIWQGDTINFDTISWHRNLNGLAADDHLQYALLAGRTGDILHIDTIQALDSDGLSLFDDGGSGITVMDGGNVGIGLTIPTAKLHTAINGVVAIWERNVNQTYSPTNRWYKSRGTTAIPLDVYPNDGLGNISFWGYKTGAYRSGVEIKSSIEDTTASNISANLQWYTTNSSYVQDERMRLTADGNLGIGSTNPQALLDVNGNIHGDTLRIDSIWENTIGHGVKIEGIKFYDSIVNSLRAIQFTTGYTDLPHEEAKIWWDDDNKTLTLDMEGGTGVRLQVGQEEHLRVVNTYGSTIVNGSVCNLAGTQGQRPTIGLALADTITRAFVVGISTHDIPNSSNGYVVSSGLAHDIPMNGTAEGEVWNNTDLLYASAITAGQKTKYQPDAPATSFVVGVVLNNHATEGVMGVSLIVVPRLAHLSDVNARSNQVHHNLLRWDTTYHYWDTVSFQAMAGDYQLYSDTTSIDATRYWVGQQGYSTTTGTVTSVGMSLPSAEFLVTGSPITTAGTLYGSWKNQLANKAFIAPDGTVGQPTFRLLIANDVPDHNDLNGYIADKHYYQKNIDTVNPALTGLLKATSGVLSIITDNSTNWNTAYSWGDHSTVGYLEWSDTLNELPTDYDVEITRFDSLFIDYTNTGFVDGWVKNLGTIKVDTSSAGGGAGEVNTASNVGIIAGDAGVWFDKSGVDLRFRKVNSVNNILTIAENVTDTVIDFTVVEANIDHNQLTNYVSQKHYYQKNIDTVKNLTGLAKLTSGVISAITDNSATWNTALQWSDTNNELFTDYGAEQIRFDSLFIDYTNTGFVDGWVKNLGTIKVDTSTTGASGGDADWTIVGNNQYSNVIDNVGIGSTVPTQKLDVVGTVQMTGFKLTTSPTNNHVLTSDAAGVGTWQAAASGGNVSNTGTPQIYEIPIWTDATTIKGDPNFTWDGSAFTIQNDVYSRQDITTYSNTATTSSILDVQRARGTIVSPLGVNDGDELGEIAFVGRNDAGGWNTSIALHAFAGEDFTAANNYGVKFGIKHFASGNWITDDDLWGYRILIEDDGDIILNGDNGLASGTLDGNIGISSSAPSTKLDVTGVITATGGTSTQWNTAYGWGDHSGLYSPIADTSVWTISTNNIYSKNTDNVGIGSTVPTQKLDVNGVVRSTGLKIHSFSSTTTSVNAMILDGVDVELNDLSNDFAAISDSSMWTLSGTHIYSKNNGNVGIGSTNPQAKLDIEGTLVCGNAFYIDGASSTYLFFGDNVHDADLEIKSDYDNATRIFIEDDGNVGIGTTEALFKLDVAGNVGVTNDNSYLYLYSTTEDNVDARINFIKKRTTTDEVLSGDGLGEVRFWGMSQPATYVTGGMIEFTAAENWASTNNGTSFSLKTIQSTESTLEDRININGDGNVGISNNTPTYGLDVNGTFRAVENSQFDSNVGIGLTNPSAKLHTAINGVAAIFERNVTAAWSPTNRWYKSRGTVTSPTDIVAGDELGNLSFWGYMDSDYREAAAIKVYSETITTSDVSGYITFKTNNTSFANAERMRLTADGNLGIGSTAPVSLLDVDGLTTTNTLSIDAIETANESTDSVLYVDVDGKVGYKYLGSCFSATKTATKFSTSGTYTKLTGWTTDIYDAHCFTWDATNNELEIDVDGRYMIIVDVYGKSSTTSDRSTLYFTVYENIAGGGFAQNTQYEWYGYVTRFANTTIFEGGKSGTFVADYNDGDKIAIYVKDDGVVLDIEGDDARIYVVKIK